MNGYQISFLTVQGHKHHGKPVAEWLVQVAMETGMRGATVLTAAEGFGQHRRVHSAHFFELADQPIEVVMAVTEEESQKLFSRLEAEGVHLFYVKAPVEFGMLGKP
jgi:PII-like signaling protein